MQLHRFLKPSLQACTSGDWITLLLCFAFFPQHINAHHAYESQISSMAKAMSRLEEELRFLENEKATVLTDLSSLRELCIKLDSGKDLMTQQLNSKSLELERVGAERGCWAPCFLEPFRHGFSLRSFFMSCPLLVHFDSKVSITGFGNRFSAKIVCQA